MNAPEYTEAEKQVIRDHFATLGAKGCVPLMPGKRRTWQGIQSKAQAMEIYVDEDARVQMAKGNLKNKPWTQEEDAKLLAAVQALYESLPGRGLYGIIMRHGVLSGTWKSKRDGERWKKGLSGEKKPKAAKQPKLKADPLPECDDDAIVQTRTGAGWEIDHPIGARSVFDLGAA